MQMNKFGNPRRNDILLQTEAEAAIRDAIDFVEAAGCHPYLTEAVNLLQQAREKVADFVEIPAETDLLADIDAINKKYEGLLKPSAQEIRVVTLTAGHVPS